MGNENAFDAVLESFGDDSQVKGKRFEEAVKWWLKNDTVWKHELVPDSVLLWEESPFRNGPDIGIDLTAQDISGNNWAIQVKNWKESTALPKSEIDKFLSASNTKSFTHRLLISSTEAISSNAQRAIEDQEKPCTIVLRSQLRESSAWTIFDKDGKPTPVALKSLYPHQADAVASVVRGLKDGGKGQLIMACGSGKTITAQRINEEMDSSATLVLLPSLLLVQQTLQSWRNESRGSFLSLSICSDQSVNGDEPVSRTSDLPFPVTTDTQQIKKFLSLTGRKVIFSTYQSSEKLAEAIQQTSFRFDLVICDEAHRLAGKVDRAYGTIFREGSIPSDRYLFMTATPKVFSSRILSAAKDEDIEVNSMDDADKFGKVLHTFSFSDAIDRKVLTDYRVVLMGVDDAMLQELIQNRTFLERDGEIVDANLLASHFGVAKAMERYSIKRVISFHSRVSAAREFVKRQPKIQAELSDRDSVPMLSEAISGKDSAFRRRSLLNQLRDLKGKEFGLIGNARCLTEGVDVPSLDGIAFVDPRSSQVDIVQAVGRAIRRGGADKSVGYIIIPIFFSGDELDEETINLSKFKPVWDVLNALKSHDSSLQEEIDSMRRGLGVSARRPELPSKIIFDLPVSVPASFSSKIKTFLLKKTSSIWEEWLGKLGTFQLENGHCRPKRQFTSEQEMALGSWVQHQRSKFNKGNLSLERIAKLESVPNWTWDVFESQWLHNYEQLAWYSKDFGTSRIPSTYKDSEGKPLGKRLAKLRGKKESLSQEQIRLLEGLPDWTWDPFEDQWKTAYEEVKQLAGERNDSSFPRKLKLSDGRSVGNWTIKQRQSREFLTAEQKGLLEGLPGWSWEPYEEKKRETIARLSDFVRDFHHSNVPQTYVTPDGFKLGQVVSRIRGEYRKNKLDPELLSFFESLDGWLWNARVDIWQIRLNLLRVFVKDKGRLPKKDEGYRGEKLGWWVSLQRQQRNKDLLEPDKISELESVPNWTWDVNSDKWEYGYSELVTFINLNGKPPKDKDKSPSGFGVGSWCFHQRKNWERLSEGQRLQLERFDWFAPLGNVPTPLENWWVNHKQVLAFVNSTRRLPKYKSQETNQGEKQLGLWLMRQSQFFDTLDKSQREALVQLPGFTGPRDRVADWNEKFDSLQQYVQSHGVIPQLRNRGVVNPLGGWIRRQKKNWNTLTSDQQSKLLSIPETHLLLKDL